MRGGWQHSNFAIPLFTDLNNLMIVFLLIIQLELLVESAQHSIIYRLSVSIYCIIKKILREGHSLWHIYRYKMLKQFVILLRVIWILYSTENKINKKKIFVEEKEKQQINTQWNDRFYVVNDTYKSLKISI